MLVVRQRETRYRRVSRPCNQTLGFTARPTARPGLHQAMARPPPAAPSVILMSW